MAKDHGPSVKDDKQYEGLRKKGMSKARAAAIANSPGAESRGGKSSGSSQSRRSSGPGSGGNQSQKKRPAAKAARSRASCTILLGPSTVGTAAERLVLLGTRARLSEP